MSYLNFHAENDQIATLREARFACYKWNFFSDFPRLWYTLFENYSKCRLWILAFSTNFFLIKTDLSGTLFDRKLQFFKNSPKWTIFLAFLINFCPLKVNVARFARNVEWDFFCDFQTPCDSVCIQEDLHNTKSLSLNYLGIFLWITISVSRQFSIDDPLCGKLQIAFLCVYCSLNVLPTATDCIALLR